MPFLLNGLGYSAMALLAEEVVEEWLNRQGYFTIRGIKLGVQEIDLLAIRQRENAEPECRHLEVQASMRPVSYISRVPKAGQQAGRPKNSAKRTDDELVEGVREWVETKFHRADKRSLMKTLWRGSWSSELVVNVVKSDAELSFIAAQGVVIHRLSSIIHSLAHEKFIVNSASGADLVDLVQMGTTAMQPSNFVVRLEGSQV